MTIEEFKSQTSIVKILGDRGHVFRRNGKETTTLCPLHKEKTPSFSINTETNMFHCHGCKAGGSVVDLLAALEGKSTADVIKENCESKTGFTPPPQKPTEVCHYSYRDAHGTERYQAVRMHPKTFRQRHMVNGSWVWSMEDVERVLYNLPEVMAANEVVIVEGEKDADNLTKLGFVATTNVGGAGKWMDAYTEVLTGKDVVICGDTDKPGVAHAEKVFESLAGKVKSARIAKVPAPHKDISDYVASMNGTAKESVQQLFDSAQRFYNGLNLPLYTMTEIEAEYIEYTRNLDANSFSLGKWLPTFGKMRPLVPGEMVLIIGATGAGKTVILQSLVQSARPLPTLFFEMELPSVVMFERFMAARTRMDMANIEVAYKSGEKIDRDILDSKFSNLLICTEAKMTTERLDNLITKSALKLGEPPKLVVLDYVQIMQGKGSRYEKTSSIAEELKVIAKDRKCILVIASQAQRPSKDENRLGLHSGKDSGSLENSSSLVIGAERDKDDKDLMMLTVFKSTKGGGGLAVPCNFDGAKSRLTERVTPPNLGN